MALKLVSILHKINTKLFQVNKELALFVSCLKLLWSEKPDPIVWKKIFLT